MQAGVGPSPELCDALDNDCNGAADDGVADIVSGTDVGECEFETQSCVGGVLTVVDAGVGPSPELCDALDNDCNGSVDDDPTCPEGCGEIEVCDNGLDDECDGALDDEDGCGLLPGPGNELAVSHIRKVTTPTPPISDVAGFDDRIPGAHLSMLALKVSPVATVSEFNQLITSFDARIVNGSPASGWLRICFRSASPLLSHSNQIQTQLTASSAVSFTALITRPTPDRLPDNYSAPLDLRRGRSTGSSPSS